MIVLGTLAVYWMFDNINLIKALNKVSKVYYQVDLTEFKADRFDKAYLEALEALALIKRHLFLLSLFATTTIWTRMTQRTRSY